MSVNENVKKALEMIDVGEHFECGDGCDKDPVEAVRQYACSLDIAETSRAYYYLATHYVSGEGVEKNIRKAYRYYAKAACIDGGEPYCGKSLYQTGLAMFGMIAELGMPPDYALGVSCFEKAADLGVQLASYRLARVFKNGIVADGKRIVEADPARAFEYLGKSLVGNSSEAAFYYQYGMFLMNGIGTDENTAAGLESLRRAAEMGCPQAKEYLERNED